MKTNPFARLAATLAILCGLAFAACDDASPTGPADGDILEQLQAIPGLTVEDLTAELPPELVGYQFFSLTYDQPADHAHPEGAHFVQRMSLLHRDSTAPLVMSSGGYFLSRSPYPGELARLLDANQLNIEHRFFTPSRPEPADWSLLTIEQAATDFHRIAQALHPLYPARWVATGASKGGMTAVFFRRFFPDDVDATVAYVAPLSTSGDDPRYPAFLDTVGDDPACRQALSDFQVAALTTREDLRPLAETAATENEWTFELLGFDKAFEHAVLELPFYFWQYGPGATACPAIPGADATAQTRWDFLDAISSLDNVADASVTAYSPYFYQAATQFGWPANDETDLAALMTYDGTDVPATYSPPGMPTVYDPAAMADVDAWVRSEGERLLFIYGENDPWSAGMFELGDAQDSFRFVVPEGNHGARILQLVDADRDKVLERLSAWMGVTATVPPESKPTLRSYRLGDEAEDPARPGVHPPL